MDIKKDILFVCAPYGNKRISSRPLFSGDIDDLLQPAGFTCADFMSEQSIESEKWKNETAHEFLNMLAETFDFSVDYENLTFTYSQYKAYEGFNSILTRFRDDLRPEYLDRYSGLEALADAAIFAEFRKRIYGEIPMIFDGHLDTFHPNYYEALANGCKDENTYQISQVVAIREY